MKLYFRKIYSTAEHGKRKGWGNKVMVPVKNDILILLRFLQILRAGALFPYNSIEH